VIQRYVPVDQLRAHLAEVLVPADPELWARRIAIEEDLLTWWAVMSALQEQLASRHQSAVMGFIALHFRRVGAALQHQGATSGAELLDAPRASPRRPRHGSWRYER